MFAKVALLCLVSLAVAQYQPHYDGHAYAKPYPVAYEEKPIPYSFGYDVKDEYGSTLNRREESDELGNKKGSYGYTDGYGVYRQVDYVADEHGFRATVKTNEAGTDNQNPADVEMLSEAAPVKYDAPAYKASAPAYSHASAPVYGKPAYHAAPAYGAEHKYSAPVYGADHKYSAPVYGSDHKYSAPVYGSDHKYSAPVYSAEPKYQAPVYPAPVYAPEAPAPAHAYAEPAYEVQSYSAPHYDASPVYEGHGDSYAPY